MKELKSFKDLISPTSWLYMWLFIVVYPVVFPIGWKVILIAAVIDSLAFGLLWKMNLRGLRKKRPLSALYFENLDVTSFEKLSSKDRTRFVEDLITFPSFWSKRAFFLSLAKMTLPGIWIVYASHDQTPKFLEAIKMVQVAILLTLYFTTAVYIESHGLASRFLRSLHGKFGLKDVFYKVSIPPPKGEEFQFRENLATGAMWTVLLVLQALLIQSPEKVGVPLIVSVPVVGFISFALVTRIWTLGRKYLAMSRIPLVFVNS